MGQHKNTKTKGKWKQINEQERYKIEALISAGLNAKEISSQLNRDRRTIERELKRGSVVQRSMNPYMSKEVSVPMYIDKSCYLADVGQRIKEERAANKGRGLKIGNDHDLARYIEKKIGEERYSPDAVIGSIKVQRLPFSTTICTKTLYNYIDNGLFLGISNKDLPVKKNVKKRRYRRTRKVALNNVTGRSIEDRPESIANREEAGHWEMDSVVGKGNSCLLVLTERLTRYEMIFKLPQKTQDCVINKIDMLERRYKNRFKDIFKSITIDNGPEFLNSAGLETSILYNGEGRTIVYYAHPYSAYERGSNENANRLIRRFIPKGSDIDKISVSHIKRVERWINNYPRKIFGYRSASQVMKTA